MTDKINFDTRFSVVQTVNDPVSLCFDRAITLELAGQFRTAARLSSSVSIEKSEQAF
jgi:hypothetical protein